MQKQPSFLKIIWTDYLSFITTIIPVMIWVFYLIMQFLDKVDLMGSYTLVILSILSVISLGILFLRVSHFFSVFTYGYEVNAVITAVSFYRDRGRVEYAYELQTQKYVSGNSIMKTMATRKLVVGDGVIVVVNRDQPKEAYIRDLYL